MERRNFIGLIGGALAGGIFVPKFGRWFRPNRIWMPEGYHNYTPGDFYISQTGNDLNPGTRARPWRSLSQASRVPSGSTVNIGPGEWKENLVINRSQQNVRIVGSGRHGAKRTILGGYELRPTELQGVVTLHNWTTDFV